jgi:late competence protein required for DNA uptake (superfamily II DNA/RNA helicase)
MAVEKDKYYCQKCGKWMGENEFFTYKDKSKTEMCKKCLTMHIDNFDESTFLWLLKKMDVPYIPEE